METSCDRFLNGKINLRQPRKGFRAGADALFVAAACPARASEHVLDVGCGVGAIGLALAVRIRDLRVTGVEIQPALAELAAANALQNGFADRVQVVAGDVAAPSSAVPGHGFDHVVSNPPFFHPQRGKPAGNPGKQAAHMESTSNIADWMRFCLSRCKPGGTITLIYRTERLAELLATLPSAQIGVSLFPLWPRPGATAKQTLLRIDKDSRRGVQISPGLLLHDSGDEYRAEVQAVLRDGSPLYF